MRINHPGKNELVARVDFGGTIVGSDVGDPAIRNFDGSGSDSAGKNDAP
jgi:hypothetical protein